MEYMKFACHFRKTFHRFLVGLWCVLSGLSVFPSRLAAEKFPPLQELKLATWNLEFLMDASSFKLWQDFCAPQGWQNSPAKPLALPYCDALNGEALTSKQKKRLPLRTWPAYQQKLQLLAKMFAEHPQDIIAVQEVLRIEALAAIFPAKDYSYFLSSRPIAQNLGFVVKKSLLPFVKVAELADFQLEKELPFKRHQALRPGVELRLTTPKGELVLLNLHLKAGCKNYLIDQPELRKPWEKRRAAEIQQNCQTLKHQVRYLKKWIAASSNKPFLILGDLNRDLFWEIRQHTRANQSSRLIGSDSLDPKDPITDQTRLGLAFYEWQAANGSWLFFPNLTRPKGKGFCLFGVDQMLWNAKLVEIGRAPSAGGASIDAYKLPAEKFAPLSRTLGGLLVSASDHCLFSLTLPLATR